MIRNAWYAVGLSGDFPARGLQGHVVAGRPLVLWRTDDGSRRRLDGAGQGAEVPASPAPERGEVVCLDARCAHKRFPLWDGKLLEDGSLECAYHGFAYGREGRCVAIPALHDGADRIPATARQRTYPVVEQDGLVWLWPGDAEPGGLPPRTPEIASAEWETISTDPMPVAANARLLIENLFDLTHFYPLHADTIGSLADALVPVEIERGEGWLRTIRRRSEFTLPPMTRDRFGLEVADQVQEHTMIGPGLFHVVVRVAPPGGLGSDEEQSFVLHQTITPVDHGSLIWRRHTSCRAGTRWAANPERPLVEAIVAGAPKVVEQDRWAIERQQQMFAYPDEGYREVHIRTDGAVVMARRLLDELEDAPDLPQVMSQPPRRAADPV